MKKLRNFLICLFFFVAIGVYADNDRLIRVDQLPRSAQQFIERHFADRGIALTKREIEFLRKSYEVVFADGCRIEFDSKGEWKELDCKFSELPPAVVPVPILECVKKNYSGSAIVRIEKDRREYEVKLSNRIELTFDRKFNLIDMDY